METTCLTWLWYLGRNKQISPSVLPKFVAEQNLELKVILSIYVGVFQVVLSLIVLMCSLIDRSSLKVTDSRLKHVAQFCLPVVRLRFHVCEKYKHYITKYFTFALWTLLIERVVDIQHDTTISPMYQSLRTRTTFLVKTEVVNRSSTTIFTVSIKVFTSGSSGWEY